MENLYLLDHGTKIQSLENFPAVLVKGRQVVCYESRKRELKRRLINEGRCDERLKAKVGIYIRTCPKKKK
jgi:hypothetical protein